MKKFLHAAVMLAAFHAAAQSVDIVVPPGVRLPQDSTTRSRLLASLNGLLALKDLPAWSNAFVLQKDVVSTAVLMDELRDVDKGNGSNDASSYSPCLLNVAPLDETNFLIQFAYTATTGGTARISAAFRMVAQMTGDRFRFSTPLLRDTAGWKVMQTGDFRFHYQARINSSNVVLFARLCSEFDARLKATNQVTERYCCGSFPDALRLLGVDYKASYNARSIGACSSQLDNLCVFVDGGGGLAFDNFDPHDLWHYRLRNVLSTSIINRPVDEGCAYLYGGSWGLSWTEILALFKKKLAGNPDSDWLALYNSFYNFGESKQEPLIAGYVMNALIVQRIEGEKGFDSVMKLLACGKYEKSNANYFQALDQITGINRSNFNAEIWKLIRAS